MKLPKTTKNTNPEFVAQKRRGIILDAFRYDLGFQVRDNEREQKIESIVFAEYGDTLADLERAYNDLENGLIRFEFASKNPTEQHGELIVGEKQFAI